MKKILHKAKHNGKWIFGHVQIRKKTDDAVMWVENEEGLFTWLHINKNTICEYIGEKNRTKFWSNDTTHHDVLGDGVIVWGSTGFLVKYDDQALDLHEDWRELKVTGNIFDKE